MSNFWNVCKSQDGIVSNITEGTSVCKYWGSVKEYNVIDESSEWRNFGNDGSGKNSGGVSNGDRTGGNWNTDLESYGIETVITGTNDESSHMKKISKRFQSSHDRNIKAALYYFKHYSHLLNLPGSVQDIVKNIYASAEKSGKLKGKCFEAKIAAIIYMASKIANRPKNLREIIHATGWKKKDVTKWFKMLTEFIPNKGLKTDMSHWMTTLCSRLGVSHVIEEGAQACVRMVWQREMLTGRNPNTIAGACLYLIVQALEESIDLKSIADCAGLAESTIKETYKKIYPKRVEITPKWLCKYLFNNF